MSAGREGALDALRGAAVVAMVAVHAERLRQPWGAAPARVEEFAALALTTLLGAEPLITALFVAISGRAAALGARAVPAPRRADLEGEARGGGVGRVLRRTLGLHALAVALCLAQYGPAWPDALVSPGVLTPIAVGSAAVALAWRTRQPRALLALGAAGVLLLALLLERRGSALPGLDGGPGGLVPLVAFALVFGALVGAERSERSPDAGTGDARGRDVDLRWLVTAMALTLPAAIVAAAWSLPLTTVHTRPFPAGGGAVGVSLLLGGAGAYAPMTFWNHSVVGSVALLAPVAGTLALARWATGRRAAVGSEPGASGRTTRRSATARRAGWPRGGALALLGRHALLAYVGHLVALGTVTLLGWEPRSAVGTWGLVATLCAGAVLGGALLERGSTARSQSKP